MKKLYTLSLVLFGMVSGFAQVFYSENMGVPTANTPIDTYVAGTAPATFQNGAPIMYSGTADVRATSVSTGYTGASGGGNVFITSTLGKYFQIDGLDTSAYASANLELTFGINAGANLPILEQSTNGGVNWTAITYTTVGATAWKFVTIGGGLIPSSSTLSLRWSQLDPVPASANQYRIDDVQLRNGSNTCTMTLGATNATCDAFTSGTDTYSATIAYTGAGNGTYNIVANAGTIGGDVPTDTAEGTITITGIPEGTNLAVTVTGMTCNLSANITSPQCAGVNALPYIEPFNYTPGTELPATQNWTALNSGDNVTTGTGSLSYAGVGATGNSAMFTGTGAEAILRYTPVTTDMLYVAFLMQVTDFGAIPAESTGSTYFASVLGTSNTTQLARVFFKRSGDNYLLGGSNQSTTVTDSSFGTELYNLNDVVLVVIGYDFTNNVLNYWFNPDASSFDGSQTPTITEIPAAPNTTLSGFLLRQDSNNLTPSMIIDEIRVSQDAATLLGVGQNQIDGLKVYPNPVTNGRLFIDTVNNAQKTVAIYDVLGKQVLNTTTSSNEVNVSGIKTGVYIVKITEEGKTATRKLVIK